MPKLTNITTFQKMFVITLLMVAFGANAHEKAEKEFVHGITIKLHHDRYYYGRYYYDHYDRYHFAGPADGENGETDIAGHSWQRIGKNRYQGKHHNTGPFGAPSWWSSDAGDGALIYVVEARIDKWTEKKSLQYYMKGFTHYHPLVNAETGQLHPKKVAWLKHVAVKTFEVDGPDMLAATGLKAYTAVPGIDYNVTPNWAIPYNPNP